MTRLSRLVFSISLSTAIGCKLLQLRAANSTLVKLRTSGTDVAKREAQKRFGTSRPTTTTRPTESSGLSLLIALLRTESDNVNQELLEPLGILFSMATQQRAIAEAIRILLLVRLLRTEPN